MVQQDLISEGKLHSNGFAVLLSTLARKEINATGTCLISDQVILYVLIQTSERRANHRYAFCILSVYYDYAIVVVAPRDILQKDLNMEASRYGPLAVRTYTSELTARLRINRGNKIR